MFVLLRCSDSQLAATQASFSFLLTTLGEGKDQDLDSALQHTELLSGPDTRAAITGGQFERRHLMIDR